MPKFKSKIVARVVKRFFLWLNILPIYPGCDEKMVSIRRTLGLAIFIGFMYVFFITALNLINQPHASISLYFYLYLVISLFVGLILTWRLKKSFIVWFSTYSAVNMLMSFYFIFKNGGLTTSYSYLLFPLGFVLLILPFQKIKGIIAFFSLFSVLTIVAGVVGSTAKMSAERLVTPEWNTFLSVVNILFLTGLGLFMVVIFLRKQQKMEHLKAVRQHELNEAKIKSFINVIHEFRNSLTVIQGITNFMDQRPEEWVHKGTDRIRESSYMLLRLVNQLLDISKIESREMPIHLIQQDIASYIGFITEFHRSAAIEKKINLVFHTDRTKIIVDFDPDITYRILTNLLGNAIKFTPEGGRIEVSLSINKPGKKIILKVSDNGKGIPADKIQYLFKRYYQLENPVNSNGGSGLGLAITKELVLLMEGKISVESEVGKGAVFTVQLPITHTAHPGGPSLNLWYNKTVTPCSRNPSKALVPVSGPGRKLPVLLVVEDSKEVSMYLSAILKNQYRIELADNGKLGLKKAIETVPDIILSDVIMPGMDGIEMLGRLKNHFRTSHIPVVMLTAKGDIDSRLAGLEQGADAYITKPFNEMELYFRLHNLIELRKKLYVKYSSLTPFAESYPPGPDPEDAFVGKVKDILEKNLGNDAFNVSDLCQKLAISHTQLYRKFKSISKITIADYLKLIRLNKAKELLATSELNITQIAFETGFKNLSHFSREFALHFGKSPKEMRKAIHAKPI